MKWFLEAIKKYAVFNGRARGKEFWSFFLLFMLFFIIYAFVLGVIPSNHAKISNVLFASVYMVLFFIPSISVSVRRLHDTGKSGLRFLLAGIPYSWPYNFFNLYDRERRYRSKQIW